MLQTVVLSRLPWLQGTADLVLLVILAWALHERVENAWFWTLGAGIAISLISATPFFALLIGYIVSTGIARLFRQRAWQNPILAMYISTFFGTFLVLGISYTALVINGVALSFIDSLSLVMLPGLIWNMLLALPVFSIISDLAEWVYPVEIRV